MASVLRVRLVVKRDKVFRVVILLILVVILVVIRVVVVRVMREIDVSTFVARLKRAWTRERRSSEIETRCRARDARFVACRASLLM